MPSDSQPKDSKGQVRSCCKSRLWPSPSLKRRPKTSRRRGAAGAGAAESVWALHLLSMSDPRPHLEGYLIASEYEHAIASIAPIASMAVLAAASIQPSAGALFTLQKTPHSFEGPPLVPQLPLKDLNLLLVFFFCGWKVLRSRFRVSQKWTPWPQKAPSLHFIPATLILDRQVAIAVFSHSFAGFWGF